MSEQRCTCVIRRGVAFPNGVVVEMCGKCANAEREKTNSSYANHVGPIAPAPELDETPPWEQDESIPMADEGDEPWRR